MEAVIVTRGGKHDEDGGQRKRKKSTVRAAKANNTVSHMYHLHMERKWVDGIHTR